MSHLDPEQLALLALGEPVASDDERAHLQECPACAAEITEMAHAAAMARATINEGELFSPPTGVWSRIHEELHLGEALASDPLSAAPGSPAVGSSPVPAQASLRPRSRRRAFSPAVWWALAASLVLVVGIGGAATWVAVSGPQAPSVIAAATLDAFDAHPGAAGQAEVGEDADGARTLTVTLDGAGDTDDYREVWLIRNDGEALISLGILGSSTETFTIPATVDLDEYDLVDISNETVDGNPAHSGDSIVRGQLGSV